MSVYLYLVFKTAVTFIYFILKFLPAQDLGISPLYKSKMCWGSSNRKCELQVLNKHGFIFLTLQEVWILFLLASIQWLNIINVCIFVIFLFLSL